MTNPHTALVLGATGNIGSEVAKRLVTRGWTVRALHRDPANLTDRDETFEWRRGDAMSRQDVVDAARGTDLIVHAVNPPGYHNWAGLVLPMIDNTIAAARSSGARILLPGTVYNYGPDAFPVFDETAPQHPRSRKGAIRVAMERRLQDAAERGVRSLIVRAGDFFGPGQGNNWLMGAMVKPDRPIRSMFYPGKPGTGHQWAYVPDVAETMLRLVERERELPDFATFHMRGHWDENGARMVESIRRAARRPQLKVRAFPWWAMTLAAPFSELFRELKEMRYLWQHPARMDNARLTAFLGDEPHTPWHRAVGETLAARGCLAAE
jgi:nucleoside-diphosphate-sugar epimerase